MTRGGGEEWGKASAPTPAPARIDGPTLQFVESMIVHAWKRSAATGPPHAGLGADKGMWRMKSRARADIAFCHAHAHTLAYDPRPPPWDPPVRQFMPNVPSEWMTQPRMRLRISEQGDGKAAPGKLK